MTDPADRRPLDAARVRAQLGAVPGVGRVEVVATTPSTSADLVAALGREPGKWPDRSVLVTDHQSAGRGRAGRAWQTPAGVALTASWVLRPAVPVECLGWVPLLGGLAVVRALADVGVRATVKWPNDVLVDHPGRVELAGWGVRRKVAGVLADLVPTSAGPAVVLGIGVNVHQAAAELPVESATSLRGVGVEVDRAVLLAGLTGHLVDLDTRWRAASGDAEASGLARACATSSATLGARVEVELPGGGTLRGVASGLGPDGALVVTEASGRTRTVLAGDVRLRLEGTRTA
ncbi:biotin--[acetyl-CoA-carboxylase] ligase [Cellulomonas sp. APG4]|uniref:biotin--[acetyl-CoA-carboxylase] ligase n=1 Tax=Cellulomonas sp. APG4 TaxID=1538656 RepID=UPI00351AB2CC